MDVNAMLRQTAQTAIQGRLDEAVKNGDTDAANKAAQELATLAVQTAPKAPPFGDAEVRGELEKQPWFGIDPKKSAKALEFGKTMDPKKFASAEAFAKALTEAVDAEFKPAAAAGTGEDGEGDEDEPGGDDTGSAAAPPTRRRTDGPKDGDLGGGNGGRASRGPWTKMSQAPSDVQADVKRQAQKMLPGNATKEQRETFETRALETHYRAAQAKKASK